MQIRIIAILVFGIFCITGTSLFAEESPRQPADYGQYITVAPGLSPEQTQDRQAALDSLITNKNLMIDEAGNMTITSPEPLDLSYYNITLAGSLIITTGTIVNFNGSITLSGNLSGSFNSTIIGGSGGSTIIGQYAISGQSGIGQPGDLGGGLLGIGTIYTGIGNGGIIDSSFTQGGSQNSGSNNGASFAITGTTIVANTSSVYLHQQDSIRRDVWDRMERNRASLKGWRDGETLLPVAEELLQ